MLAALMLPASTSVNRVDLSKYGGKWSGSGWGKRDAGAPRERVRCRMTAKYRAKTRRLSVSGKCAAASRSFTLLGHVAEYRGSNRLTGRWVNPSGMGSVKVAGRRNGNNLIFTFRAKDRKLGKMRQFRTVWKLNRNSFTLNSQVAKGGYRDIGSIRFSR